MKNGRSRQFRDAILACFLHMALVATVMAVAIWVEGKLSG